MMGQRLAGNSGLVVPVPLLVLVHKIPQFNQHGRVVWRPVDWQIVAAGNQAFIAGMVVIEKNSNLIMAPNLLTFYQQIKF